MKKGTTPKPVRPHRPLFPWGSFLPFPEYAESSWEEDAGRERRSVIAQHTQDVAEEHSQWPTEAFYISIITGMVDFEATKVGSLLQRVHDGFATIESRLSSLEANTKGLQEEIAGRPVVKNITLYDLHTETLALVSPLQILLEEYEDETVARFAEIEAFGYGETEPEAIADLKNQIVALYEDLNTSKPEELGKLPRAWLRILNRIIVKRGETKSQLQ